MNCVPRHSSVPFTIRKDRVAAETLHDLRQWRLTYQRSLQRAITSVTHADFLVVSTRIASMEGTASFDWNRIVWNCSWGEHSF